LKGCAIAQVVDHCPVTTEALHGIYGQQSGSGKCLFQSNLVFPCRYHCTNAPFFSSS